jgi:hypothetical protein
MVTTEAANQTQTLKDFLVDQVDEFWNCLL